MHVLVLTVLALGAAVTAVPCTPGSTGQGIGCLTALLPCPNGGTGAASIANSSWTMVAPPNLTSIMLQADANICLNVQTYGTTIGDNVWVTECHPEDRSHMLNRQWVLQSNGNLINPTANLCLDTAVGASSPPGAPVTLQSCKASSSFTPTIWTLHKDDGTLRSSQTGLCLAIASNQKPPPAPMPPTPPAPPSPPPFKTTATVSVDASRSVAKSSDGFVSFNFDWHKDEEELPVWINMSVQKIDLTNPILLEATAALAPGRLRVGGSEGDKVFYDVDGEGCDKWSPTPPVDPDFCLNMTRWHQIIGFAKATGTGVAFGLNAMVRANESAPSNLSNHEAFFAYTAAQKLEVYGFEFGNELPNVDPVVMGNDYLRLRALINKYWPDATSRPKLIGNDLNTNPSYLEPFLKVAGPAMDVVTYHNYVGYGLDPDLPYEIPTLAFLNEGWTRAGPVYDVQRAEAPQAEIWVGEIAAAWHSGQENTTNAFVSSLWYADTFGVLSLHNHTGFCRQCLLGGSYGLLRNDNYHPNPDYYTGLLWHRLMGNAVFNATATSPHWNDSAVPLRSYAHCSRLSKGGVVVAIVNIDPSATVTVSFDGVGNTSTRNRYLLTAPELQSRSMDLNGETLALDSNGHLPAINPVHDSTGETEDMPPISILFVEFPSAGVSACQ